MRHCHCIKCDSYMCTGNHNIFASTQKATGANLFHALQSIAAHHKRKCRRDLTQTLAWTESSRKGFRQNFWKRKCSMRLDSSFVWHNQNGQLGFFGFCWSQLTTTWEDHLSVVVCAIRCLFLINLFILVLSIVLSICTTIFQYRGAVLWHLIIHRLKKSVQSSC